MRSSSCPGGHARIWVGPGVARYHARPVSPRVLALYVRAGPIRRDTLCESRRGPSSGPFELGAFTKRGSMVAVVLVRLEIFEGEACLDQRGHRAETRVRTARVRCRPLHDNGRSHAGRRQRPPRLGRLTCARGREGRVGGIVRARRRVRAGRFGRIESRALLVSALL